jgi:uncharacterized protein YbjT (DUF2867 family)
MTRVLVAGATGYLGGYVAKELAARGYFVRALVRSLDKAEGLRTVVDELVEGEVTKPETLQRVCDDIDVVFSSVGITRQKDGLTFQDVDYQGNKNLLDVAMRAGVRKFVYVSVLNGPDLLHLAIVKAHEDFVAALKASGLDYAVLRPTGFFSDMSEYLAMARKGRVYLIGRGRRRVNPIHGADLASVCVDSMECGQREIDVGGPEILTHREIAELAFRTLEKPARISSVPVWIMRLATAVTKLFSRHRGELLAFFTTAMSTDVIAPCTGNRTIAHCFSELPPPTTTGGFDEQQ